MHQGHIYSHHNEKLSQYDPDHPYIPLTMFLMLPSTQDDYYIGQGKTIRRFLFQGTATETYTKFELQKYKQFQAYWQNNKQKIPRTVLNNPFWNYSWKMRWLTSEQYDVKNTIKAMEMYTAYLATNLTNVTTLAEKNLKSGIFYVSGRDAYMRPILVFDIDKMIKRKMTQQELIQSQKIFFQKILNQYLLPGQVQTWVAVIDVGYQNLLSLISPLKASIGFLSNTFRNRMRICYVVRTPGSISFLWKIIKTFMKQDTANKINFIDDQVVGPLLKSIHPSQLQVKYGGTQPQIKQFWPLRSVKRLQQLKLLNFSHPQVVSIPISQEAYKIKYDKKKLQGHTICKILIEDSKKQQKQQLNKLKEQLEKQAKNKQQNQQNNRIQKKESWPIQYKPLAAPVIKNQDIITWQKLLI